MKPDFKRILVVRTDRVGDVVLTIPALTLIRKNYPKSHIAVLVAPATKDIVNGHPDIDEVIVYDKDYEHKGIFGFWKMKNLLQSKKFDVTMVYHTKQRTNLLCFLAGIPRRIGYHNQKYGFLLTDKIFDDRPQGIRHESEYCLEILKQLGLSIDDQCPMPYMPIKEQARQWVKQFYKTNNIEEKDRLIAIHPGGSDYTKRWPREKFAELINQMGEKYPYLYVLVGSKEVEKIARTIQSLAKVPLINAVGQTSIAQLAALLERCQLLISNDSGPVHVATAVGTPVISIFGQRRRGISVTRWHPLGSKDIAIEKEIEKWEDKTRESSYAALQAIETEEVLRVVERMLT